MDELETIMTEVGRPSYEDYSLWRNEQLMWLKDSFGWQAADQSALLDIGRFQLSLRLESGQFSERGYALASEAIAIADRFAMFSTLLLEHFQAILLHRRKLDRYLLGRGPEETRELSAAKYGELAKLHSNQRAVHEELKREHGQLMEQLSGLKLKLDSVTS